MRLVDSLGDILRSLLARQRPFEWQPGRIGPRFEWLDHDRIRVLEGPLRNHELGLRTEVEERKASIFASLDGRPIGRTYIERDPPGRGIELWDIAVREELRRMGVASIMTYVIFRELLSQQKTAFFKIRMMKLMKPADRDVELQNVGIGVIGNRLGFTPEYEISRILEPSNITGIDILPGKNGFPPSYKIVIRTFPLVLIAFVLDADSLKPVDDLNTYVRLMKDERVIYQWAGNGQIVIGNGNYWLRRDGLDTFVNRIAADEAEARIFRRRVRAVR